jgi:hypothetical protein
MQRKPLLPQFVTALLLAWCLSGGRSAAEVRVSGTPDRVVVQTSDAPMPEILTAMHTAFELEVTLKGTIAQKFSGMYSGSVRQVLGRLLTGENYVLRTTADGISIIALGKSASAAAAPPDRPQRPGLPPQTHR